MLPLSRTKIMAAASGLLMASVCLCSAAFGAAAGSGAFTLTSQTFKDGQMMPRKVANKNAQNPNCVGDNVSPQLSWSNPPAGTKSYALTMVDPEGRGGLGVHHWVAYGIPANVMSFAEGDVTKDTDKYVGGKSRQGVGSYSGPRTTTRSPQPNNIGII